MQKQKQRKNNLSACNSEWDDFEIDEIDYYVLRSNRIFW